MPALVDRFCPAAHEAPLVGACYDPLSGRLATVDEGGTVAVWRSPTAPERMFRPLGGSVGAVALHPGGRTLAVGDADGSVGVYRTDGFAPLFERLRTTPVAPVDAVAINTEGTRLAVLGRDGLVRIEDIVNRRRLVAWSGFGGRTVRFDTLSDRLLGLSSEGQVQLVDLHTQEALPVERLPIEAAWAAFAGDGTLVVAAGPGGLAVLRVADGALLASFAAQGGSGIIGMAVAPEGDRVGVVTGRSVHEFLLPALDPAGSWHHGVARTTGCVAWDALGLRVGGADGRLHGESDPAPVPPTDLAVGSGEHVAAAHDTGVAIWRGDRRLGVLGVGGRVREMAIARSGRLLAVAPEDGPLLVLDPERGRRLVEGGAETVGAHGLSVGGPTVAALLPGGGLKWWVLDEGVAYRLEWARAAALTGGGTWVAAVTPGGAVRLVDVQTGTDAAPPPVPLADVPVVRVAFVNRRPELLVVDASGVLGRYPLERSVREQVAAEGEDILDFSGACAGTEVLGLWGVTGGRFAVLKLPSASGCTMVVVDLERREVAAEHDGLHPGATVDTERGRIVEPARGAAIRLLGLDGQELKVLRSLPGGEWIAYDAQRVLDRSAGAGDMLN